MTRRHITALIGDGIGREILMATHDVHSILVPHILWDVFPYGEETGGKLTDEIIMSVKRNKLILKGPTGTPQGGGYKSPARLIRGAFDLYANVRPVFRLPNVPGPFSHYDLDFVVVRENTGTDYAVTENPYPGGVKVTMDFTFKDCERIAAFAFKYAEETGRKRVHVMHKSNIIKLAHAMFRDAAYAAQKRHPSIECKDLIIDNFGMQLMRDPSQFDVMLHTNLFGDIFSDINAGMLHQSLGFAGSLNAGDEYMMAEAVHGTAPDIVGKGVANPAAMMLSECLLLDRIGEAAAAKRWREAIVAALKDGIVTKDVDRSKGVGTKEWTDAVIARL